MSHSEECLICGGPSQTDIDGKGVGKRKLKGSINVVQSQLRSIFLLQKLLELSSSACVNLLKNGNGINPSGWFSCCWSCFTIVEECEKIYNELTKLERQMQNLKTEIQMKLRKSYDEIQINDLQSGTTNKKSNMIIFNTIRKEVFEEMALKNGHVLQVPKEEHNLTEDHIKIEVDKENVVEETDFADDNHHENSDIGHLSNKKRKVLKSKIINLYKRTRSGRIIKPKFSAYETDSESSADDLQNDWADNNNISGNESDCDNEEEWRSEKKTEKSQSSASRHKVDQNELSLDGSYADTKLKCKHCHEEFSNPRKRHAHEISAHENLYEFNCNHCFKKYLELEALKRHLRRSHNGKINPDPLCPLMLKGYKFSESNKSELSASSSSIRNKAKKSKQIQNETESETKTKCKHCEEEFRNGRLRHAHQVSVHGDLYKFQCGHCKKKYLKSEHLTCHIRRFHDGKINPDPSCSLKLKRYKKYRKRNSSNRDDDGNNTTAGESDNQEENENNTKSKCKHCEEEFHTARLRHAHEISVHGNLYKFECSHCMKKYLKLELLHCHIRRYHNGKINADPSCTLTLKKLPPRGSTKTNEPFICEECNYDFKTKNRLNEHMSRVHRNERNFICEICSRLFSSNSQLRFHQRFKHGDSEEQNALQCKECGKILSTPISLTRHINTVHKNEFPFRCSICNVGKPYQSALDRHILNAHTDGPKPYVCNMCEKSYASKNTLEVHKRTHTGERPFKCPLCNKWFHDKKKMLRHKNSLHAGARDFECEQCGSKFPSKHYLNSHVYSTHNKKKSSLPPKTIMDKEELAQYVQSANKAMREVPITAKGKKNRSSICRLLMEKQLKQKGLLINDTTENETENQNKEEKTEEMTETKILSDLLQIKTAIAEKSEEKMIVGLD